MVGRRLRLMVSLAHFEHTVLVTEGDPEILTKLKNNFSNVYKVLGFRLFLLLLLHFKTTFYTH